MPPPISPLKHVAGKETGRKIFSRPQLMKFKGQRFAQTVTNVAYNNPKRTLPADVIHREGSHAFWTAKDNWHVLWKRDRFRHMPFWDRAAQTLILFTRNVTRVPQETAFRLLAVHLKIMMVQSLTAVQALTLPVTTTSMNLEQLMWEAKEGAKKEEEGSTDTPSEDSTKK